MGEPKGVTRLRVDEAVELATALVAIEARQLGVRYIVIKGDAARRQGLRPPRVASDVDVLVSPEDRHRLVAALGRRGWRERPHDDAITAFPIHSWPLIHDDWPCDIDLHDRFPGCDVATSALLDCLLAAGAVESFAQVLVAVPGRPATAVIQAAHALRTPFEPARVADLEHLVASAPRLLPGAVVLQAARQMGAVPATAPFLRRAYPDLDLGVIGPPSREWVLRQTASTSAAVRLIHLLEAPWRRKPQALLRALVPSREAMAAIDLQVEQAGSAEIWLRRWRRLREVGVHLPRLAADVRAYRRRVKAGAGE